MDLFIMLLEQILAVVVAIRRTKNGMDMTLCRLGIVEPDACMGIKFKHDHRALDTIVEWVIIAIIANPAPMGTVQVFLDLLKLIRSRRFRKNLEEGGRYIHEPAPLPTVKLCGRDAFIGDDAVGCCQTNSNQSLFIADKQVSGSEKLAPFEKSGVA